MSTTENLRIGVVLEAFLDLSLEDVLKFLAIRMPRCIDDRGGRGWLRTAVLIAMSKSCSPVRRRAVGGLALLDRYDMGLDALNAWGNPLHPDARPRPTPRP